MVFLFKNSIKYKDYENFHVKNHSHTKKANILTIFAFSIF